LQEKEGKARRGNQRKLLGKRRRKGRGVHDSSNRSNLVTKLGFEKQKKGSGKICTNTPSWWGLGKLSNILAVG